MDDADTKGCYTSGVHKLRTRYGRAESKEPMNAEGFAAALRSHLRLDGRHCSIRVTPMRLVDKQPDDVLVRFVNLPEGVGGAGGGAEAENNRATFWVRGFGFAGAPSGKARVETSTSVFSHKGHKMRSKSGPPAVIAKYLADHINGIVAAVPPHFTHSSPQA
jgi:hypothetical protein